MNKHLLSKVVAGVITSCLLCSAAFAKDGLEERIVELESQLTALQKAKPSLKLGKNTTLSYGGFINVYGGEASETSFDSTIATSRLFFKTATNTDVGVIKSHLEFDMFNTGGNEVVTNSTNPRIRHAYLSWQYSDTSSVLIGQSWSTFFNVGALPESVEFIGPTSGSLFNRQNQIRWTKKNSLGSFMLALENPATVIGGGVGVVDENSTPDVIARLNAKWGKLAWTVSAIGREIAIGGESKYGGAVNLSGKLSFNNGNDIKASFSVGNLGRYIALGAYQDGIVAADGIELSSVIGGYIAYKHKWTDKLRSTIQYAYSEADLAEGLTGVTEKLSNININLMYSPTSKLTFGGAVILADRTLDTGVTGDLTRFQIMAKFVF